VVRKQNTFPPRQSLKSGQVNYWGSDCNSHSTGCGIFLVSYVPSLTISVSRISKRIHADCKFSLRYRKKKKAAKIMRSDEEGQVLGRR
jgi:hypothetical protein